VTSCVYKSSQKSCKQRVVAKKKRLPSAERSQHFEHAFSATQETVFVFAMYAGSGEGCRINIYQNQTPKQPDCCVRSDPEDIVSCSLTRGMEGQRGVGPRTSRSTTLAIGFSTSIQSTKLVTVACGGKQKSRQTSLKRRFLWS